MSGKVRFWKPGKKRPTTTTAVDSAAAAAGDDDQVAKQPTTKKKRSGGTRLLSNVTRNMRFMQRGTKRKQNLAEEQTQKRRKRQEEESLEDDVIAPTATPGEALAPPPRPAMMDVEPGTAAPADSPPASEPVTLEASVEDMYGAALTGRRSFGGFNPVAESQWKAQHDQQRKRNGRGTSRKRKG